MAPARTAIQAKSFANLRPQKRLFVPSSVGVSMGVPAIVRVTGCCRGTAVGNSIALGAGGDQMTASASLPMPARRGDPPVAAAKPAKPAANAAGRKIPSTKSSAAERPRSPPARTTRLLDAHAARAVSGRSGAAASLFTLLGLRLRSAGLRARLSRVGERQIDIEGKRLGWSRRVRRGHARELRKLLKLYFAAVNKTAAFFLRALVCAVARPAFAVVRSLGVCGCPARGCRSSLLIETPCNRTGY